MKIASDYKLCDMRRGRRSPAQVRTGGDSDLVCLFTRMPAGPNVASYNGHCSRLNSQRGSAERI